MKRIFVHISVKKTVNAIFDQLDYEGLFHRLHGEGIKDCPNLGNQVWLQGLVSEITTQDVQYDFLEEDTTVEQINENYDLMIFPTANIFSTEHIKRLEELAERFSQIKIPIYVISCGAQADSYAELNQLCDSIGDVARKFIDAVYQSGGEFGLRGYFTKEFFDKLGFHSAEVTGCPSLYQMGRNLHIEKPNIQEKDLKPVINGHYHFLNMKFFQKIFDDYENAVYVDQDYFGRKLYDPTYPGYDHVNFKWFLQQIRQGKYTELELLTKDRVLLFSDMPNWREYLIKEQYNFSFGGRIHGNILSILSGIPAIVYGCDSRTREMAEFYDIPTISRQELDKKKSLFELYEELDYTKFNQSFAEKYDKYEDFFIRHGILSQLNSENIFFNEKYSRNGQKPEIINQDKICRVGKEMQKHKNLYKALNTGVDIARSIKNN